MPKAAHPGNPGTLWGGAVRLFCLAMPATDLPIYRDVVRPEWIDYNGHMNVAYYLLVFDRAVDVLFEALDLGASYMKRANSSCFALETHLTYRRELRLAEPIEVRSMLVEYDRKRLRHFHSMHNGESGTLAATCESLSIHVDMASRKSAAWGEAALARLQAMAARHSVLARPAELGRAISLSAPAAS
jgi:acyl-CoA thioester hydrolase